VIYKALNMFFPIPKDFLEMSLRKYTELIYYLPPKEKD
jgi:hypothetical protein